MGGFWAAVRRVDVTPPIGLRMAGYEERKKGSEDIHDPLFATALVISDGTHEAAIVSLDLAGVDLNLTDAVRKDVSERTGMAPDSIALCCSHTHSGPAASRLTRYHITGETSTPSDEAYYKVLQDHISGAITAAKNDLKPARIGYGFGQVFGVGTNRRAVDGPCDRTVGVLRVEDGHGDLLAGLVNFACHPTVLSHQNYKTSADYPAYAVCAVERAFPGAKAMFLQGAGGDISTRHTRRASSFEECERLGTLLGAKASEILASVCCTTADSISFARKGIALPAKKYPAENELREAVDVARSRLEFLKASGAPYGEVRTAYVTLQGAERSLKYSKRVPSGVIHSEMQAIKIGNCVMVFIPSELFNEYGVQIRALSVSSRLFVVAYSNDTTGYVLTPEAIAEGGYEAGASIVDVEAGRVIVETAKELIEQVGG